MRDGRHSSVVSRVVGLGALFKHELEGVGTWLALGPWSTSKHGFSAEPSDGVRSRCGRSRGAARLYAARLRAVADPVILAPLERTVLTGAQV